MRWGDRVGSASVETLRGSTRQWTRRVAVVVCFAQEHHAKGGAGATALGEAVMAACKTPSDFKFLYDAKLLGGSRCVTADTEQCQLKPAQVTRKAKR